jgi:hypothetical protein
VNALKDYVETLERTGAYVRPAEKDAIIDLLAKGLFTAQGC